MKNNRVLNMLNGINRYGKLDKGVTRLAFSKEDREARDFFILECKKEGLDVRIDSFGNIIARREGIDPNLPVVAFGSHLDTVVEAGYYDGVVGVVAGLEVINRMNAENYRTHHPLELIVFACEESSRFNVGTLGSKAMTGLLSEELNLLIDKEGTCIEEVFMKNNLNIFNKHYAKREVKEVKIFLELHIEQGPILEKNNKSIGIVKGIASSIRFSIVVLGQASHSGSTPMGSRKDALVGASEIVIILEEIVNDELNDGTVGTIGVMDIKPGVMNVIPGKVKMKVDVRGSSIESMKYVENRLKEEVDNIVKKRELLIEIDLLSREKFVSLNERIIEQLIIDCNKLNIPHEILNSGANHDTMNMSKLFPAGLIFIPSKNGISHNPDEFTSIEEIEVGIDLLEETIKYWANSNNKI